jgi:hypothetical protein
MSEPVSVPYSWDEKHLEQARLPVPGGPDDAGKPLVVNTAGDGYVIQGGVNNTEDTPPAG